MFLGSDEDLDPGISSILFGMSTTAVLNKYAAKLYVMGQWEFLCDKEVDMRIFLLRSDITPQIV
jgi:hypothetical protein